MSISKYGELKSHLEVDRNNKAEDAGVIGSQQILLKTTSSDADSIKLESTTGGADIITTKDLDLTSGADINITASSSEVVITTTNIDLDSNTVAFQRDLVTQDSSITTGVTVQEISGVITTVSSTLGAVTAATFTVSCDKVLDENQVILANIIDYSGTFNTNGRPEMWINNVTTGNFDIILFNSHPTNNLSGAIKIAYLILGATA